MNADEYSTKSDAFLKSPGTSPYPGSCSGPPDFDFTCPWGRDEDRACEERKLGKERRSPAPATRWSRHVTRNQSRCGCCSALGGDTAEVQNGAFHELHVRMIGCLRPACDQSVTFLSSLRASHPSDIPATLYLSNIERRCLRRESLWSVGAVRASITALPLKRTDRSPVSGLSAAHTIYLNGGNVLLLDKNSKDEQPLNH